MTHDLRSIAGRARRYLAEIPDGPTIGIIKEGRGEQAVSAEIPIQCQELYRVLDGVYFGVFALFSSKDVLESQYLTESIEGGRETWFCFGTIIDDPVILQRATGEVWWFPPEQNRVWWDGGSPERISSDPLEFMDEFVFGPGYARIGADLKQDRWWDLLETLGRTEPHVSGGTC
jgi:hypothetical protein